MLEVAQSRDNEKNFNIIPSALYNMGRAHFMVLNYDNNHLIVAKKIACNFQ